MRFHLVAFALACAGCADTLAEEALPVPAAYTSQITYAMPENNGDSAAKGLLVPSARVEILDTPYLNRPSEIVGVVDVNEEMGQHQAALDALRRKAAEKGANAVLEVESRKAARAGESPHLSGLAVRYLPSAP